MTTPADLATLLEQIAADWRKHGATMGVSDYDTKQFGVGLVIERPNGDWEETESDATLYTRTEEAQQ